MNNETAYIYHLVFRFIILLLKMMLRRTMHCWSIYIWASQINCLCAGILGQIVHLAYETTSAPDHVDPSQLSSNVSTAVVESMTLIMDASHLGSVQDLSLATVIEHHFRQTDDNMVWYLLFTIFVSYGMLPLPLRWALFVGAGTSLVHLAFSVASFVMVSSDPFLETLKQSIDNLKLRLVIPY